MIHPAFEGSTGSGKAVRTSAVSKHSVIIPQLRPIQYQLGHKSLALLRTCSTAAGRASRTPSASAVDTPTLILPGQPFPSTSSPASAVDDDVLIEFRDVYKSFGSKKVLNGATFKIRRGEAVGIIGASGTGKSTTLRLASGLLACDSGQVLIRGQPRVGLLSDDTPTASGKTRSSASTLRLGMVFQNAALFDSLTVGENVGFLLYEHSQLSDAAVRAAVADSLAKVGLRGVENLYPSELSGGMRKRVALARAVVSDPSGNAAGGPGAQREQVIMYDEPTAGLDPVASTVVEDLMRSLQSGNKGGISTYIVVTHQHSTIRRAVDRVVFLHQGKVVWQGSVAEFDTTDEPIVRQFAQGTLEGPISYI